MTILVNCTKHQSNTNFFPENRKISNTFQLIVQGQHYFKTKCIKGHYIRMENCRPLLLMDIGAKILNK